MNFFQKEIWVGLSCPSVKQLRVLSGCWKAVKLHSNCIKVSLREEFCLPEEAGDLLQMEGRWRSDPSKAMPCTSQGISANPESSIPRGIQAKIGQVYQKGAGEMPD